MKKGDLIMFESGRFATVVRDDYSFRFMEPEDYEMEDHGMGHLAGLYGTAFDVMLFDTGQTMRLKSGKGYTVLDTIPDSEKAQFAIVDH